ncbi:hypothetical protein [Vibrio vulnificus YJ016]|uniref:Uncharacterized protein n=1 Tax=Vibrio vulnificus (strain YJ016) TaxID=196600 RepID=Q7MP17_VIBVY|nr:hypothetical protein [Vibrio vulnificus YJ016]
MISTEFRVQRWNVRIDNPTVEQAFVFVAPLRTASSTSVTILSRSEIGISLPR